MNRSKVGLRLYALLIVHSTRLQRHFLDFLVIGPRGLEHDLLTH
jgi:hypothetical protein